MWFLLTFQQLVYDLIIERTTAVNLGKLVRFIHKKIVNGYIGIANQYICLVCPTFFVGNGNSFPDAFRLNLVYQRREGRREWQPETNTLEAVPIGAGTHLDGKFFVWLRQKLLKSVRIPASFFLARQKIFLANLHTVTYWYSFLISR